MRGANSATAPARVPEQLRRALEELRGGPRAAAGQGGRHRGQGVTAAIFSQPPPDTGRLRSVLGQFATGVTVVAAGGETPCGMTANSFTSVSLDPPLILICVTRELGTVQGRAQARAASPCRCWPPTRRTWRGTSRTTRGRGARPSSRRCGWSPGPGTGAPVLNDALAWLDCAVTTSHDGGDHEIFLGSVLASGAEPQRDALLFFRGGFCRSPHD